MINQIGNILTSILAIALASVILSKKSNTEGVTRGFFGGFASSIRAAGNAGR